MLSEQRKEAVTNMPFKGIRTAAFAVPAVLAVSHGNFENIIIKESVSPRIEYDGSTDYFEVIDVDVKEISNFTFVLNALCDCLGFRKWAVLSEAFLIAPDGKFVALKEVGSAQTRTLTGAFLRLGMHKLVVIAKSKFDGQLMGRISGQLDHLDPATKFGLPLVAHPTGVVQVNWIKEAS